MAAAQPPYITIFDKVVGLGHLTLPDVANRVLKYILTMSGMDVDNLGFIGFKPLFNVKAYGAKGDGTTDDTAAFVAAAAAAAGNGEILVPWGRYIVSRFDLPSNSTLTGNGWGSIIKQKVGTTFRAVTNVEGDALITCNLNDALVDNLVANNKRNIVIKNIALEGNSVDTGFVEVNALIGMQAVSDVLIERVKFTAQQGDGFVVYSGCAAAKETHSENVTVRKCTFDGVNYTNRNGISLYDIDGAVIEDCLFTRLTRADMPGAVDVEGRLADYVINRNVEVRNCTFTDIGAAGTKAGVILYFYNTLTATVPRQGFKITGCKFKNTGGIAAGVQGSGVAVNTPPHGVVVEDCRFQQLNANIQFYGLRGVRFLRNTIEPSNFGVQVGTGALRVYDYVSEGNTFNQVAQTVTGGYVYLLNLIDGFHIERDTFIDCGRLDNTAGVCVGFGGGGAFGARRITTKDCNVVSTNTRTKAFFEGFAGGGMDITSVRHSGRTHIDLSGTGAAVFSINEARYGRTDDAGVHVFDSYTLTSLPSVFPVGATYFGHSSGTGPGGQTLGAIETIIYPRQTGVGFDNSYQRYSSLGFAPGVFYLRYSNSAGTAWGSWYGFTGLTAPLVAIVTPTAPSAAYVQAEAQAMKVAVDALRVAVQNGKLTA